MKIIVHWLWTLISVVCYRAWRSTSFSQFTHWMETSDVEGEDTDEFENLFVLFKLRETEESPAVEHFTTGIWTPETIPLYLIGRIPDGPADLKSHADSSHFPLIFYLFSSGRFASFVFIQMVFRTGELMNALRSMCPANFTGLTPGWKEI